MGKEITIYELSRLTKNDKAPKRIKFNGDEYYLEDCGNYVRHDGSLYIILDENHPILTYSNDKVEIIERR